jgi:Tfp pilus assembly protein PilV
MKRRAVSVIEMVVAAAVFAVSVLVLFGIFPISARSVRQAEQRLMAAHIADNRLELCRSMAFANINPQPPQTTTVLFRHQDELVTQEYSMEQAVSNVSPSLKNVEVIVRWKSDNRDQELRLETQVASLVP